ncbi:MAG: hypothetical protein RI897_3572 [Verrucomicrobiota bacterium]
MTIDEGDGPLSSGGGDCGDGIEGGDILVADGERVGLDMEWGDAGLEVIGVHGERMEVSAAEDAGGVDEEGAARIDDGGDVGHADILGVAEAGIEEGGGEEGVCHGVLGVDGIFIAGLDQAVDFRIGVVLDGFTRESGVVPSAQVPFIEGDLDSAAVAVFVEDLDKAGDGVLGFLGVADAGEVTGGIVGLPEGEPVAVDRDVIEVGAGLLEEGLGPFAGGDGGGAEACGGVGFLDGDGGLFDEGSPFFDGFIADFMLAPIFVSDAPQLDVVG